MHKYQDRQIRILFVCTGNIYLPPTAQGVFYEYVKNANLDKYFLLIQQVHMHGVQEMTLALLPG